MKLHISSIGYIELEDSIELIPNELSEVEGIWLGLAKNNDDISIRNKSLKNLISEFGFEELLGILRYQTIMSNPIFYYLEEKDEVGDLTNIKDFDELLLPGLIKLMQTAMQFALACWFVKDCSCECKYNYMINNTLGYECSLTSSYDATSSAGIHVFTSFSSEELLEAMSWFNINRPHLMTPEADISIPKDYKCSKGNIDISSFIGEGGTSFFRVLKKIQEARMFSSISSKLDKYCSALECLFCISEKHRQSIASITANYIGGDYADKKQIYDDMKAAYGIRSDSSHGDNLKFLNSNDSKQLTELSQRVDNYVRIVLQKAFQNNDLNYGDGFAKESDVKAFFKNFYADASEWTD